VHVCVSVRRPLYPSLKRVRLHLPPVSNIPLCQFDYKFYAIRSVFELTPSGMASNGPGVVSRSGHILFPFRQGPSIPSIHLDLIQITLTTKMESIEAPDKV
jgi:hypothetical protein